MAKHPFHLNLFSPSDRQDCQQWGSHEGLRQRTITTYAIAALTAAVLQSASCASDRKDPRPDAADDVGTNPCGALDPSLREGDLDMLFAATSVPTFDFYLPQADWENLKTNAIKEEFVPAQACYQGRSLGTIGLRFKGSYGTLYECFDKQGNMICPRLSMKVKFDEYVDEQRFYGLKRLSFNAYRYDDSRMKEKLAYDLFRDSGLVAPRSAWAVLRVNGQSQGLYGMVEPVDGRFTAHHFPQSPDGNLYKEVWPTHASDQQLLYGLDTNTDNPDVSGYRGFAQAFMAAPGDASRLSTLDKYMGLDYLARFMAAEDAVISYDGTTYFFTDGTNTNNHNYYVYEESPTKFTLIAWDLESTFWIDPNHAAPHWTVLPADCSQTYSYWGGKAIAPGCDGVFHALDTDLGKWRAAARALLDGPFSVAAMNAAIDRYSDVIWDAAHSDPTPTMYSSFDGAVSTLRGLIPAMRERLEKLIAPPAP
jgi:spore coat protein H